MSKLIKSFNRYTMQYNEDMKITSLLGSDNKEALFSHTFYHSNKEYLDEFVNIASFVKPKREASNKATITIDLEELELRFNNIEDDEKEELLRIAMKIIKNAISEENEELKEHKASLIKLNSDLKTLKDLSNEGLGFDEEIKEVNSKIQEVEKKIEEILEEEK